MTPKLRKILEHLHNPTHGYLLADRIGIDKFNLYKDLKLLELYGLIKQTKPPSDYIYGGGKPPKFYQITEKGEKYLEIFP